MNDSSSAYSTGMTKAFVAHGLDKSAAQRIARTVTGMQKRAAMFNFGDGPGPDYSSLLAKAIVPLLAAAGSGYIAYNAGQTGSRSKTMLQNINAYLGRKLSHFVRHPDLKYSHTLTM